MILNVLETHLNQYRTRSGETKTSVSLKLNELGLNQGVVLGVGQYGVKLVETQYGPKYTGSFKYRKQDSNVEGWVRVWLTEKQYERYARLGLQQTDFVMIKKIKPEGYTHAFLAFDKCERDGSIARSLPGTGRQSLPTTTTNSVSLSSPAPVNGSGGGVVRSPPSLEEEGRIRALFQKELESGVVLVRDDWVHVFSEGFCTIERAGFLFDEWKDRVSTK